MAGTHMHLYREDFDDRVAFELDELEGRPFRPNSDAVNFLKDFLQFCGVQSWPPIQMGI